MSMKTFFALCLLLVLAPSCQKNLDACDQPEEKNVRDGLIDLQTIDVAEFRTLLDQYTYLRPYKYVNRETSAVMHCSVFCLELPVFNESYVVILDKTSNTVTVSDTLQGYGLGLTTEAPVPFPEAIKFAKALQNFDRQCVLYSKGIYNTHRYAGYNPANYALAWKIEGTKGYPYVILDAATRQVYESNNGVIVD